MTGTKIYRSIEKTGAAAALAYGAAFFGREILMGEHWRLLPYIAMIPSVPHRFCKVTEEKQDGIYTISMGRHPDFRILQLTDIHLGGSSISVKKDRLALAAIFRLIRAAMPDLVIITGDLVFPVGLRSASFNNYTPMAEFACFMKNIGIPWAFTYGNHDTERIATHTAPELNRMLERFSCKNAGTLLFPYRRPKISGRSNQAIKILNRDGSTNQLLFLLDSNSYASKRWNDYDCVHEDQANWYEQTITEQTSIESRKISSMIFLHIPLQEYKTAYRLYKQGDKTVTYYYGKIGESREAISCSRHGSSLFRKAVRLGSTKAIFAGHDHFNNISLEYQNIRLTYGMSIDYLAMRGIAGRTEQRGGTLITLYTDSTFDIEQVCLSEI